MSTAGGIGEQVDAHRRGRQFVARPVPAGAARHDVRARAALQPVVAAVAVDLVIPALAAEEVRRRAADQHVVAVRRGRLGAGVGRGLARLEVRDGVGDGIGPLGAHEAWHEPVEVLLVEARPDGRVEEDVLLAMGEGPLQRDLQRLGRHAIRRELVGRDHVVDHDLGIPAVQQRRRHVPVDQLGHPVAAIGLRGGILGRGARAVELAHVDQRLTRALALQHPGEERAAQLLQRRAARLRLDGRRLVGPALDRRVGPMGHADLRLGEGFGDGLHDLAPAQGRLRLIGGQVRRVSPGPVLREVVPGPEVLLVVEDHPLEARLARPLGHQAEVLGDLRPDGVVEQVAGAVDEGDEVVVHPFVEVGERLQPRLQRRARDLRALGRGPRRAHGEVRLRDVDHHAVDRQALDVLGVAKDLDGPRAVARGVEDEVRSVVHREGHPCRSPLPPSGLAAPPAGAAQPFARGA